MAKENKIKKIKIPEDFYLLDPIKNKWEKKLWDVLQDAVIRSISYDENGDGEICEQELEKAFGGMRSFIYSILRETLQRFIEETKIKRKEVGETPDDLLGNFKNLQIALQQVTDDGYNHALKDIEGKQQQWLKENL